MREETKPEWSKKTKCASCLHSSAARDASFGNPSLRPRTKRSACPVDTLKTFAPTHLGFSRPFRLSGRRGPSESRSLYIEGRHVRCTYGRERRSERRERNQANRKIISISHDVDHHICAGPRCVYRVTTLSRWRTVVVRCGVRRSVHYAGRHSFRTGGHRV